MPSLSVGVRRGVRLFAVIVLSGICLRLMCQRRPEKPPPPPPGTPQKILRSDAPLLFQLKGIPAEFTVTKGQNTVQPSLAPADLASKVVVRGSGSLTFPDPGGMMFKVSGQQTSNTAFLQFSGPSVMNMFNTNGAGYLTFKWRSSYSVAERTAMAAQYRLVMRTALDAYNDSGEQFLVEDSVQDGLLCLRFKLGDSGIQYYFFPRGKEEAMFGKGVVLDVRFNWDGLGNGVLYLN